jgi:hypothetical protein
MQRPHSSSSCIQPGNYNKGVFNAFSTSCGIPLPPANAWFQVVLEARQSSVKIFVDGQFAKQFATNFPLRQKSIFFVPNTYKNIVHYKGLLIEDL